jgi:hypothetical protein
LPLLKAINAFHSASSKYTVTGGSDIACHGKDLISVWGMRQEVGSALLATIIVIANELTSSRQM